MATRNITLVVRAVGSRQAARQIEQTGNALEKVGYKASKASRNLRHMGETFRSIGGSMVHNITLPIVGVGAAAVKMSSDFEKSLLRLNTQAGVPMKTVQGFRKEFIRMGKEGTKAPNELADAMFHIASVVSKRPDINALKLLDVSRQLSTIGGSDLESTASALSAAVVTGVKGTEDMTAAASNLNAAVGQGNMTMSDLVTVMGTGILPVAKNAGLGLTDVTAAIALLTDEGMKASQAGNLMRTSFHFLTSPSDRARKAMEGIGVTPGNLAQDMQGPNGLLTALKRLDQALKPLSTAERNDVLGKIFPTGRGTPMYVLLNQLPAYENTINKIKELSGPGTLGKAYQKTLESDPAKIDRAWASIKTSLTELGGDILPTVADLFVKISDAVADITDAFDSLDKGDKKKVLLSLAGLASAGVILSILGTLGVLIGGLGQMIAATGAAGAGLLSWLTGGKGKKGKKGIPGIGGGLGTYDIYASVVNVYGGTGAGGPGTPVPDPTGPKGKGKWWKRAGRRAGRAGGRVGMAAAVVAGAEAAVTGTIPSWVPGLGGHDLNEPIHKRGAPPGPSRLTRGHWIDAKGFPVHGPGPGHRFLPAGSSVDPEGMVAKNTAAYQGYRGIPETINLNAHMHVDGKTVAKANMRAATRKKATR